LVRNPQCLAVNCTTPEDGFALTFGVKRRIVMSTSTSTDIELTLTPAAAVEVKKFMDAEGVTGEEGGLRVAVQPGGCSGFKYSLVIEDKSAEDDFVMDNDGFKVFIDPFSAQYISGVTIDYVTSMQGSGFTFKNPNSTGGCGCGSSFTA
jgi:iron-sulfur cluster assembly accessory protein